MSERKPQGLTYWTHVQFGMSLLSLRQSGQFTQKVRVLSCWLSVIIKQNTLVLRVEVSWRPPDGEVDGRLNSAPCPLGQDQGWRWRFRNHQLVEGLCSHVIGGENEIIVKRGTLSFKRQQKRRALNHSLPTNCKQPLIYMCHCSKCSPEYTVQVKHFSIADSVYFFINLWKCSKET